MNLYTRAALTTAGAVALIGAGALSQAQTGRGNVAATLKGKAISIDYGRPALGGRDMMSKVPPGFVWRLGANEATVITTAGALVFGETTIPKGSYSLFARRVDDESWELIFNQQTGQWGTQRDEAKDVASVPLEWRQKEDSTETLTIALGGQDTGGRLTMSWGTHELSTGFEIQ